MFSEKALFSDIDSVCKSIVLPDSFNAVHITPKDWAIQLGAFLYKNNPSIVFSTDLHDADIESECYKNLLDLTNILFFSGKGKGNISHCIKCALSLGIKIVCCTNGADGCYIGTSENSEISHYKAIKQNAPIIDTIGAGDIFAATFLHYYYNDKNIKRAVLKAQLQAGKSCTHKGIQDLYADAELEKLADLHESGA